MLSRPRYVLVADSNDVSMEILVGASKQAGSIVEVVRTVGALLDRVESIDFDLILLNLGLTHTDACDLIKKIREQQVTECDCMIFFITADAPPAKVAELLNAGADRILRMPIVLETLKVAVEACLMEKAESDSSSERLSFERPVLAEGLLEIVTAQFGENFAREYVLRACEDATSTIRRIERLAQMGAWREFRDSCQNLAYLGASIGAERFVSTCYGARQLETSRLPAAWRFALDSIRCQMDLLNAALIRRAYN